MDTHTRARRLVALETLCATLHAARLRLVAALVLLVLLVGGASCQRHYFQRFYGHMFAKHDSGWQDRECLLTVQGREYVGLIKTPERDFESLRCLQWEDVAESVATYDPSSRISDEHFPGFRTSLNRHYCRNPGGVWSQPGCFLQHPKDKAEERRKAVSCGIPMCPALTQLRSCPAGREYGGQLDLRGSAGCVDTCEFRHTLLGPACTLSVAAPRRWEVYYPCDVPLMDGETLALKADIEGAPPGWNIFTPVTWYLTPGRFINLTQGAEGRMLLRLPQDLFNEGRETTLRFYVRLGDSMDVNAFEFEMFLSPDTSLLEVVTLTIDGRGMHLLHKVAAAHQLPADRSQLLHASKPVPWATLMYRWLELLLTIRSRSVKATVLGAGNDPEDIYESGVLEILSEKHVIQTPRYVHLAALGGTTLAAIDAVNECGFACTEGVVKLPRRGAKYYQWAVLLKAVTPVPFAPTIARMPHFRHSPFTDRKLRLQVFNAPFSLWLSSAPILPSDVARGQGIAGRKLNVVQVLVGRTKIVVVRCGSLQAVDRRRDAVTCVPDSQESFSTKLTQELQRGQEVVLDVAASERPGEGSSLVVRVELHVFQGQEHLYKLSHPVFPRYWTLIKTNNPAVFRKKDKTDNKFLFFRILNGRCRRTQSFLQAEGCRAGKANPASGFIEHDFWRTRRSLKQLEDTSKLVTRAIKGQEGHTLAPMFQQTFDRSCLSWAAFGTSADDSDAMKRLGNQCFYREETDTPFCLEDLWGVRQRCELDRCSQNTMKCFDRAHVVPLASHSRGHCLDGTEVLVVDVAAIPSPANPTHYVFDRKYDFEVKSWDPPTRDLHLCVYLYTWDKLEVIFRIGPKQLVQNRPGAYDMKTTDEGSFLAPWRFTPYSLLDADGKWTLYHEEYALPLLTHHSRHTLTRVGYDACVTDKSKMIASAKQRPASYVLVKLRPQSKTPRLSHYFETRYYPEVDFHEADIRRGWRQPYSMIAGQNTFLRVVDGRLRLWVKGHSKGLSGSVVIFLLESLPPPPTQRVMIHFDRRNIFILGPSEEKHAKKGAKITRAVFPRQQVEVDVRVTYTGSQVRVRVRLSEPSGRRQAETTASLPRLSVRYAAVSSYNSTMTQWSLGDRMPQEDPRKKPTNGRWSKWVQKNCSKICGGGVGVMERYCTNPPPSLMGRACVGPSQMVRRCNTRECGRLSRGLEEDIRRTIVRAPASRRVQVFSSVRMACPRERITRVAAEYPEVTFFWQHHTGRFFQNKSSFASSTKRRLTKVKLGWLLRHVYAKNNEMVIDAAFGELSGLWFLVAETRQNVLTVVHVVPLVVVDAGDASSQIQVEGEDAMLTCNARGLSRLTEGNLRQSWLLNGREYRAVEHVDSTRNDILLLAAATQNLSGVWECVHVHMKTKVAYNTAFVRLRVLPSGSRFDPRRLHAVLTSVTLVSGVSFLLFLYNIALAHATTTLSWRNFLLRQNVKRMNRRYVEEQVKRFGKKETTSVAQPLPHIMHRPPTARPAP